MNTNTPPTPNVVKKYYEQKYGSTTNMTGGNSAMGVGGGVGGGGGGPGPGSGSTPNDKMMIPPSSRNGAPRNYGQPNQQQQQQSGMNPNVTTSHINMNFGGGGPNQQPNSSPGGGGIGGVAGGFLNNMNNNPNNPLGAQLSSLTSQFTSGIANLKLTASNSGIANKFTSKFMNPFSS
jgi:hypothetical protein